MRIYVITCNNLFDIWEEYFSNQRAQGSTEET